MLVIVCYSAIFHTRTIPYRLTVSVFFFSQAEVLFNVNCLSPKLHVHAVDDNIILVKRIDYYSDKQDPTCTC